MTSAAHEEQDIDETIGAFDEIIGELLAQNALARR